MRAETYKNITLQNELLLEELNAIEKAIKTAANTGNIRLSFDIKFEANVFTLREAGFNVTQLSYQKYEIQWF